MQALLHAAFLRLGFRRGDLALTGSEATHFSKSSEGYLIKRPLMRMKLGPLGGVWIRQCAKVRILMPVCFATCFGLNSNILNAYYCNMSQESNTISFVFFQFVLLPMLIDH